MSQIDPDKTAALQSLFPPAGAPPAQVARLNTEDLTSREKLKKLHKALRDTMGDDYDPVIRLAELAEQCVKADDLKTAVTALNSIADRLYPKLKAFEIDDATGGIPLIIDGDPQSAAKAASRPAKPGDKRFPFE